MTTDKMEKQRGELFTKEFHSTNFFVKARAFNAYVEYQIYEIISKRDNGQGGLMFAKKDWATLPADLVESIDEAQVFAHGTVKWDGCSNWHFDEQDNCMLHGCTRHALINIGEVLAQCWDWTNALLPNFEGNRY